MTHTSTTCLSVRMIRGRYERATGAGTKGPGSTAEGINFTKKQALHHAGTKFIFTRNEVHFHQVVDLKKSSIMERSGVWAV